MLIPHHPASMELPQLKSVLGNLVNGNRDLHVWPAISVNKTSKMDRGNFPKDVLATFSDIESGMCSAPGPHEGNSSRTDEEFVSQSQQHLLQQSSIGRAPSTQRGKRLGDIKVELPYINESKC